VKNPNCITIPNIFIFQLFSSLVQSDRYLLFLLFGCGPSVKNGLFFEIEVIVLDLKSFIYFYIEECSRIERNVYIDILLVVEARFQVEDAKLGGYFEQFEYVLICLFIFYVSEIFGRVDVLQHEIFIVFNGKFVLLFDQIVVLAKLKLKLIDEYLDLLLRYLHSLLRLVSLLQQLFQKVLRLEFYYWRYFEQSHACLGRTIGGRKRNDVLK
jgi:hypothetical protein